jgi:hypothetical protein
LTESDRTRLALGLCVAAVVAGAAVRWPPCFNDFWLDEIWTWSIARNLDSASQVFTSVHNSNNHHLNTLLSYWIGDRASWAAYRVPSYVAGVATVALAAAIAWRRGRIEAVFAAALASSSFALIHFSSEARGYSLTVALALTAFLALDLELARSRVWCRVLFAVSVILGFLCHLSFGFFYAGAVLYTLRLRWGRPGGAAWLASLHAAPLAACVALFAVDLRHMTVGGGPQAAVDQVLARTFGYALGLPIVHGLFALYTLAGAAIVGLGIRMLALERNPRWILYAVAICVAPLGALATFQPNVVAVRYFLVSIALALLLYAFLLAHLYRAGGGRRAVSLALLALFVVGHGVHTVDFFEYGRGGYRDALLLMARESEGERIVVSSDHEFRNATVLRFYARILPEGTRLDYRAREERPPGGSDWVVRHALANPEHPALFVTDDRGNRYTLVAEFPFAAISGFHWAVYRNAKLPVSEP